jgi:hypothetical protein
MEKFRTLYTVVKNILSKQKPENKQYIDKGIAIQN